MKNRIPFILLAIIHTLLLVFTIYRKGKKTFPLLMISIGITYVFEYVVLNVFKMYWYYPKVFRNNWIDSVFGAFMSQSLFVPIAGTLLTLFSKGWKWRIGVSFFYALVERVFIHLGVYKNRYWSTFYTVTAMPLYFYVLSKWWEGVQKGNKVYIYISVLFFYWVNYTNVLFFSLALFNKYRFRIGFIEGKYWEHFILVPIYTLISGFIGAMTTVHLRRKSKLVGMAVHHLIDRLLFGYKIIHPSNSRSLYALIPIHITMLLVGEYYYSLIRKVSKSTVN
ncbi:hypothetical protein IM538_08230 [Cytobacillus suaedae]|nr:hypothetical protein IM538_08230 [Cytobacillus suaedae]